MDAVQPDQTSSSTGESTEDFIIKRLKSNLSSYQFEKIIAHLLERIGYRARVTQASGDGGVDIIAHKDDLGFEGIVKVQCKQTLSNRKHRVLRDPDLNLLRIHTVSPSSTI